MGLSRRTILGASGLTVAGAMTSAPLRAAGGAVLVELFTSQGCSSCPPADRLLARLASRPGVLVLSWHVDYWDRLGWKDPHSLPEATARQRGYARALGLRTVYTPQAVIDGRAEAVGSDERAMEAALKAVRRPAEAAVALTAEDGALRVRGSAPQGDLRWRRIDFLPRAATRVLRGENSGRELAHVNVVVRPGAFAAWGGGTLDAALPRASGLGTAVVIEDSAGRVLGAASVGPA